MSKNLGLAEDIMKDIDITDSVFIAAALSLKCPIWSNDKHFRMQNKVTNYKTIDILKLIEI